MPTHICTLRWSWAEAVQCRDTGRALRRPRGVGWGGSRGLRQRRQRPQVSCAVPSTEASECDGCGTVAPPHRTCLAVHVVCWTGCCGWGSLPSGAGWADKACTRLSRGGHGMGRGDVHRRIDVARSAAGTNVMFILSTEEPVLVQVVGHSEHSDACPTSLMTVMARPSVQGGGEKRH